MTSAVVARQKAEAAKQAVAAKHVKAMLKLITKSLDDDKAEDIVAIDLAGKTPMADYMVVASGRSGRHVAAIADHVMRRLKEDGFGLARAEGMTQGDWVLIDAGDIVIHIFRPEVREFYRLEKMWSADIPADASEA
ncbi:MAG: ribosome silencing factor [Parvibaculum sp.]|nr:ribosome silencing factor [Parvibaculum sp.]